MMANEVPERICAASPEDVKKVRANAKYSDGTLCGKKSGLVHRGGGFCPSGTYRVTGRVHQNHYEFPVAWHRADPCIGKWKGKYYFIATNDYDNNHSLYIREADTIPELVTARNLYSEYLHVPPLGICSGRLSSILYGTSCIFSMRGRRRSLRRSSAM